MNAIKKNDVNFNLLKCYLRCFIKTYFKAIFLIKTWQIWRGLYLIFITRMFWMLRRACRTMTPRETQASEVTGTCGQLFPAEPLCNLLLTQIKVGRKSRESGSCSYVSVYINIHNKWNGNNSQLKSVWFLHISYDSLIKIAHNRNSTDLKNASMC